MAQQYNRVHTVTSDLTTVSLGFRPTYLRIDCSTANTAFISFTSAVATTGSTSNDSYQLTTGSIPLELRWLDVGGGSSAFTALASTGSTGTIRVLALRI
jgi:hypothetical protein